MRTLSTTHIEGMCPYNRMYLVIKCG